MPLGKGQQYSGDRNTGMVYTQCKDCLLYTSAIAYMFTDPMITLTDMFSAWETMCAGQLRSMTWATGDMRV